MFRKIRSKRDPERSIWNELGNEFNPYLKKVDSGFILIIQKYPKHIFTGMLILIIVSAVLAATVLRPEPVSLSMYSDNSKATQQNMKQSASGNFFNSLNLLQETLTLQEDIKKILDQPELSANDSLLLERKIHELELIESEITK